MTGYFEGANWIDVVFIVLLIVSALTGLFRGGMREMISLLSWLVGYAVAMAFSRPLAGAFANTEMFHRLADSATQSMSNGDSATHVSLFAVGVSFIVLFSVTVFIGALIGRVINNLFESGGVSFINRLVGIVMGLGRGWLASLVLVFIGQLTPIASEDVWGESKMVELYRPGVQLFSNLVSPGLENLKKRVNPMATEIPLYREP